MKFDTKLMHVGYRPDPVTGALMPPIYMTSTYAQHSPGEPFSEYDYTRAGNPNFTILEEILASLEQAQYATVFGSGLGALTGMLSTLQPGDLVLAFKGLYGGTFRLFEQVFKHYGIRFMFINPSNENEFEEAIELKPKWIFFETPTNPLLKVYDIAYYAKRGKEIGALTVVDNTFATPYFQNPLELGADVVWHSMTKYLGGHSDIVGGVVMTNDAIFKQKMDFARKAIGLNPSPFDAWLVTRGLRTLAVRMQRHAQNAEVVADYLKSHPLVQKVYYPKFFTGEQKQIVDQQMKGYGGMVSVEFKLALEQTKTLISSFKLFSLAESLGGVESLVCHPATMTHASIPREERLQAELNDGLVRFSVGIEDVNDLCQDLAQALNPYL